MTVFRSEDPISEILDLAADQVEIGARACLKDFTKLAGVDRFTLIAYRVVQDKMTEEEVVPLFGESLNSAIKLGRYKAKESMEEEIKKLKDNKANKKGE